MSVSLSASTVSVIAGAASSLVSVMLAPVTVTLARVASKEMVSLSSRKASSVGVRVKVCSTPWSPAGMVRVMSATSV